MQQWTRRLEPKSPGWFALVVAATAAVVVFCGSALGLGGEPAVGEAQPLILTLRAPPTCETLPAEEALAGVYDENGEPETVAFGWINPGDLRVRWAVSGGTAPYRLAIDGETRDGETAQLFAGASGEGLVSCARTQGESFFIGEVDFSSGRPVVPDERQDEFEVPLVHGEPRTWRHHREKPDVDSGPKTVRATVTDAAGATAEASVVVYVILSVQGRGVPMGGGETYRVSGTLITVPEGIRIEMSGSFSSFGGPSGFALRVLDRLPGQEAWINVTEPALDYVGLEEISRHVPPPLSVDAAPDQIDLHAKFDELIASVGKIPSPQREDGSK